MIRVVLLGILLSLAACAELQQAVNFPPQDQELPATVRWLEAARLIRESSPERQLSLQEDWEKAFRKNHALDTRMQLILLLATGDEQVRDPQRARRLLYDIDPLPKSAVDREFIALLQSGLEDQAQYERKLAILWKQVTVQSRRVEELEQQLHALTTIERNIQSREQPAVE